MPWEESQPRVLGPLDRARARAGRRISGGRRRRSRLDTVYEPVDLNDPQLLAQDGWAPSEGNPQFHQQMVYAVAMTTIGNFEKALGRKALWAPRYATSPTASKRRRLRVPKPAHLSARAAHRQRLLQPGKKGAAVRLFPSSAARRRHAGRAPWCSPACRTTSSRTRRPTRCSTACTAASRKPPTRTCWPSTRASPTSSRCSSTSPCPIWSASRSPGHAATSDRGRPSGRPRTAVRRGQRAPAGRCATTSKPIPKVLHYPDDHRGARPRLDPGLCGLRRVSHDRRAADHDLLRLATGGTGVLRPGAMPSRSGRSADRRDLQGGEPCPAHVHSRARLLSAG